MIWKYYPPTGVLKQNSSVMQMSSQCDLEVLPAYWGIETLCDGSERPHDIEIWKYYPPTGVLKLNCPSILTDSPEFIWKYYPPTGVLKQCSLCCCEESILLVFGSTTRLLGY